MTRKLLLTGVFIIFGAIGALKAQCLLSYQALQACVSQPNSTCLLNAGTYNVDPSQQLRPATGVTIQGCGTSPFSSVLKRTGTTTGDFIHIPVDANNRVTIRNITIDGNRFNIPNPQQPPPPQPQSGFCGQGAAVDPCGPLGGYGCTKSNDGSWIDVIADGDFLIDNVVFQNSGGTTALFSTSGKGEVQWSLFQGSRVAGAWFQGTYHSKVHDNTFQSNGAAGLAIFSTGGADVYNNIFDKNRYENADGGGGGQVYIAGSADSTRVYNNWINGEDWQTPMCGPTGTYPTSCPQSSFINGCYPPRSPQAPFGIEAEAGTSNTSLLGNEILRNPGAGITIGAVTSLTTSGYTPQDSTCPSSPW